MKTGKTNGAPVISMLAAWTALAATSWLSAGERWRVADQPDLKQALEKAPLWGRVEIAALNGQP